MNDGVTAKEVQQALTLLGLTRDELAENLRTGPGVVVTEADEWRPMADHVAELIALALKRRNKP